MKKVHKEISFSKVKFEETFKKQSSSVIIYVNFFLFGLKLGIKKNGKKTCNMRVLGLCRWRCAWRRLLRQPAGVLLPEQRPGGGGGPGDRLHPAGDHGGLAVLLAGCSSRGKTQSAGRVTGRKKNIHSHLQTSDFLKTFTSHNCIHTLEIQSKETNTGPRDDAFDSVFQVSAMETPTRSEPVAQEDKTKLLKTAFLQFCRYVNKRRPNP